MLHCKHYSFFLAYSHDGVFYVQYKGVKDDSVKMASRSVSLEVEVAGVIPTAVRAELVKELVKFILYQRNQIPMYFDQLTDLLARESQPEENSVIYLYLIDFCTNI